MRMERDRLITMVGEIYYADLDKVFMSILDVAKINFSLNKM